MEEKKLRTDIKVEYAVKMDCESCSTHVHTVLKAQKGVDEIQIDLAGETVIVTGNFVATDLVEALTAAGRDVRIIGSGSVGKILVPEEIGTVEEWGAAVGEFKGKMYDHGDILGVIRMVQSDTDECLVNSELSGLKVSTKYALHIHEFGDTRNVHKTVGKKIKNSLLHETTSDVAGAIKTSSTVPLHVWELIGRSIVLYEDNVPLVATVVARSAGVGANTHKRLCTCDGTVIWNATN